MKISKSHGSAIESVETILNKLKKTKLVTKVALGYITVVKRRDREERIKWKEISGGVMLTVVSGTNKQEIYIYTENLNEVLKELKLSK